MNEKDEEQRFQLISSGKSKIRELQRSHYLHNNKVHYESMSTFEPIDINIMDSIMDSIVAAQEKREKEFLKRFFKNDKNKSLDSASIDELTKRLNDQFDAPGHSAVIDSDLNDIIDDAFNRVTLKHGEEVSKQQLKSSTKRVITALIKKSFTDECTIKEMKKHLGSQIENYFSKTDYNNDVEQFKEDLVRSWSTDWEKATLEYGVQDILNEILKSAGKRVKVKQSGAQTRKEGNVGLMQKADDIFLKFGISDKNYNSIKNSNSGTITLHTSGTLSNFYDLVKEFNSAGRIKYTEVKQIAEKFQKDDFIYHLINGAAHMGGKRSESGVKLIASGADNPRIKNGSAPAVNLIAFIKKCLPLFMGTQLKIKGNETNIDFFNINGTFIPASKILKEVFSDKQKGKIFKNRINLYSNYVVNWDEMLKNKRESDEEYAYSNKVQSVGGEQGDNFYNSMNIGRMHLIIALKDLKQG